MDDLAALKIDRTAAKSRKPRGRKGSPWVFRIAALLVVGALAWLFYRPIAGFVDRVRLPEVQVVQVVASHPAAVGAVSGTAANGYIVASRRAALSADTPGRIVELHVTEGTVVKKGFVVARLYSEEYEAALARASADVVAAKADVARAAAAVESAKAVVRRAQRNADTAAAQFAEAEAVQRLAAFRHTRATGLFEKGIESQDLVDAAKADLETADAKVVAAAARARAAEADTADSEHLVGVAAAALRVAEARVTVAEAEATQAQATLDKTYVRAPFDGIVVLKDAEVGEVVSPNSQSGSNARGSVCTMVDFASLEVQAEVPETSIAGVELGAPAQVFLDAYPATPYAGRVDRIWPTANRQKATIEVRVAFTERDERLRPDMGVRIVFAASDAAATRSGNGDGAPQILIPADAVVDAGGRSGTFVLERDTVRFQALELGDRRAGRVAVRSGLRPGQRIVLKPPADLSDGSRVRVADGE